MNELIFPLYELGSFAPLAAGFWDGSFQGIPVRIGYSQDDRAVGLLIADCLEDSVLIRWISVDTPYQRTRVGSALLEDLCEAVKEIDIFRAEAAICLPEEERRKVVAFFRSQGFDYESIEPSYQFPLSAFLAGPMAARIKEPSRHAVPLSSLTSRQLKNFNQHLAEKAPPGAPLSIDPEELLAESMAWVEQGKVTGCILLAPCEEMIELRWLYGQSPAAVAGQLAACANAVLQSRGPDVMVHALALNPSVERMIEHTTNGGMLLCDPVIYLQRQLD